MVAAYEKDMNDPSFSSCLTVAVKLKLCMSRKQNLTLACLTCTPKCKCEKKFLQVGSEVKLSDKRYISKWNILYQICE